MTVVTTQYMQAYTTQLHALEIWTLLVAYAMIVPMWNHEASLIPTRQLSANDNAKFAVAEQI